MGNEMSGPVLVPACIPIGLTWLWFTLAMICLTDAACFFTTFLALLGSGTAIGFVWVIVTLLCHRLRTKPSGLWFSIPLAGALAAVLVVTSAGLALRVYLCDGALGEFVASVPPQGIGKSNPSGSAYFESKKRKSMTAESTSTHPTVGLTGTE